MTSYEDYRLPASMVAELDDIQQVTGHSHGYSLQLAVSLLAKAVKIQSEGGNILIRDGEGNLKEVVGLGITTR